MSADVFGAMKNGNYWGRNNEDIKRRGDEICRGLSIRPTKTIVLTRGTCIKGAFGGKKTKTKICEVRSRQMLACCDLFESSYIRCITNNSILSTLAINSNGRTEVLPRDNVP